MRQLLLACLLPSVHTLLAQCGKTWWLHRGGERSLCRLILTDCGKKSDMPCKGCVAQGHSNACFLTMLSATWCCFGCQRLDYGVACVMQQLSSDSMTALSPTIVHTHLCHTFFHTHTSLSHLLSHTSLSHTVVHTHLCHTFFHTHLCHTFFHTHLCHTPS